MSLPTAAVLIPTYTVPGDPGDNMAAFTVYLWPSGAAAKAHAQVPVDQHGFPEPTGWQHELVRLARLNLTAVNRLLAHWGALPVDEQLEE